jgi:hypothetical protein
VTFSPAIPTHSSKSVFIFATNRKNYIAPNPSPFYRRPTAIAPPGIRRINLAINQTKPANSLEFRQRTLSVTPINSWVILGKVWIVFLGDGTHDPRECRCGTIASQTSKRRRHAYLKQKQLL